MKKLLLIWILLAGRESWCQKTTLPDIDSIVYLQSSLPGTYQYDYSSLGKKGTLYTRFELQADTSKRQLLKAIYTEEGQQAFIIHYYFHNNQLIKVETMKRDEINKFPAAVYYFFHNKLVAKRGRNLTLQNEKLSVSYILKQRDYLLGEFNYFINN